MAPAAGAIGSIDQLNWPVGSYTSSPLAIAVGPSAPGRTPVTVSAVAQEFRAGVTGSLDAAALQLWANCKTMSCPATVSVQVKAVDACGRPSSAAALAEVDLAQAQLPATDGQAPSRPVPLAFATPGSVVAGTEYAVVITASPVPQVDSGQSPVNIGADSGDTYPNGSAWVIQSNLMIQPIACDSGAWYEQPAADLLFATYVTPQ